MGGYVCVWVCGLVVVVCGWAGETRRMKAEEDEEGVSGKLSFSTWRLNLKAIVRNRARRRMAIPQIHVAPELIHLIHLIH